MCDHLNWDFNINFGNLAETNKARIWARLPNDDDNPLSKQEEFNYGFSGDGEGVYWRDNRRTVLNTFRP